MSTKEDRETRRCRFPLGAAFGKWVVIAAKGTKTRVLCRCGGCGTEEWVSRSNLWSGNTEQCRDCGRAGSKEILRKRNTRHGHASRHGKSRAYVRWEAMRARCYKKNWPEYHRYGGRGITVCEHWQSFANFLADMGEPPIDMQLDRIDNDGNYEPKNCRWVTRLENCRNRSTLLNTEAAKVIRHCVRASGVALLAALHGVKPDTIRSVVSGKSWATP